MSGSDTAPHDLVRVRPTDDALPADRLEHAFGRLHRRLDRDDGRLVCWLVSDGDTVEYLLESDALAGERLRELCRGWLPEGYDVSVVDRDPLAVLPDARDAGREGDGDDTVGDDTAGDGSNGDGNGSEEAATELVAVRYRGVPARHDDWQTTIRPVERTERDGEPGPATGALARVAATLARHDGPAVYQAVLEPKPDWSAAAEQRCYRLGEDLDTLGSRLVDYVLGDPGARASTRSGAGGDRSSYRRSGSGKRGSGSNSNSGSRSNSRSGSGPGSLPADARRTSNPRHRERIRDIRATDQARSFDAAAGVVLAGPEARAVAEDCATAFEPAAGEFYRLAGRVEDGEDAAAVLERLRERALPEAGALSRARRRLPGTSNARDRLVLAPATVGHACLLDGAALDSPARRALGTTPAEKTGLDRPDADALETYRPASGGMTLGRPLDADGEPGEPVALPPALQRLHVGWFGATGAGKSTALVNAILDNHAATEGADVLVDPKGDGLPEEYLRAHLAEHGSLEDVYYFDCTATLPALSFFDIRADLEAGIDRTTAVADVVDHYEEILIGLMGRERFEQAVRAPDVIRYLVRALFDPHHGADAFTHTALQEAVNDLRDDDGDPTAPSVSDDQLQTLLDGVTGNSATTLAEIVNGVANRIEKVPVNHRLGRLFDHVPDPEAGDPHFDLQAVLDEDCVVVLDTSGLRPASRRAVTLVVLSELWTALRRRKRVAGERTQTGPATTADGGVATAGDGDPVTGSDADDDRATGDSEAAGEPIPGVDTEAESEPEPGEGLPLVNLYLEEAAEFGDTDLLEDLLAKGRGFGLSVTLAMQFPGQLRRTDPEAYAELFNNVATVVTGPVALDTNLAARLATAEMGPEDVSARLRALERGQWLARLPAPFDEPAPQPFTLASAGLPPGHPDTGGLPGAQDRAFDALVRETRLRTRREAGIAVDDRGETATEPAVETADHGGQNRDREVPVGVARQTDSALPHTRRLPRPVGYDAEAGATVCQRCGRDYPGDLEGLLSAVDCCHDRAAIDRDAVPVCDIGLTLSPAEVADSDYTLTQLLFLRAVYDAHQGRFDPEWEYDLVRDSMVRLQEYVGIDTAAVEELVEAGLLTVDCTRPHRLYTVTSAGRDEIGISHRAGVAHGDGQGDLGETSLHRALVLVGERLLERELVADPDSAAERVERYHAVDEDTRLDVAALDGDGDVVAAAEAERARANHDALRAVPADYDKMAACDPERAVWLVKGRSAAHAVLDALNHPGDGEPRVERSYREGVPPQDFIVDQPGCTEIVSLKRARDSLLE